MTNSVFETLKKIGVTSETTKKFFNGRTRDVEGLNVWKDSQSDVVFIDDFYTGDETYVDGGYRDDKAVELKTGKPDFERTNDAQRRFKSNFKFVAGKKIADFGCGSGDFLKLVHPFCESVIGIEL